MRFLLALALLLGLGAAPLRAQSVLTTPAIPARTLTLPAVPSVQVSGGHALALGIGLFAGAVLGSALIHGGALAAGIGAAAGLAVGHWAWTEGRDGVE